MSVSLTVYFYTLKTLNADISKFIARCTLSTVECVAGFVPRCSCINLSLCFPNVIVFLPPRTVYANDIDRSVLYTLNSCDNRHAFVST